MATNTEKNAEKVLQKMSEDSEDGVWRGSLSALISDVCHLSYYSGIRDLLIRSGAATQLHRGGGSSPSVWQIIHPDATFSESDIDYPKVQIEKRRELADRVADLERLIGGVSLPQLVVDLKQEILTHSHGEQEDG